MHKNQIYPHSKMRIFKFLSLFVCIFVQNIFLNAQVKMPELPQTVDPFEMAGIERQEPLKPNWWTLIIYRPENSGTMNDVRCFLQILNAQTDEDVTLTCAKIGYQYIPDLPDSKKVDPKSIAYMFTRTKIPLYTYKKTPFLSGGMAMYLYIKSGKYKFSVSTPKEKTNDFITENDGDWTSNVFYYDTENPTNVIFVSPTANENGFYNGGWFIDYKAPEFYKFTKPKQE